MEEEKEPTPTITSSSNSTNKPPTTNPATDTDSLPWVEKYRPKVLSDVVGNTEAVERLSIIAQQGNMPNIILTGPPGTGK